ncbi:MAG: YicC/YloC family endoribonuclease [Proteocatella sp.]
MTISMTGYGRGEYLDERYHFTVEAKSVNNRYLDIQVKLPRKITYLEEYIKQSLKKYATRGKVDIFVKLELGNTSDTKVSFDSILVKNYHDVLMGIEEVTGASSTVSALDLARLQDVIKLQEKEIDQNEIKNCLDNAMNIAFANFKDMRRVEGAKLQEDILERCILLTGYFEKIEALSENIEIEYQEKLILRLVDMLKNLGQNIDEQRIVQEAAILADKANVTEEIVRFKSHILQLKDTLEEEDSVGRKMDFILQEMNREVNTIGSKSSKIEITNVVVDLKCELEKIREQVQNIE